MLQAVNFKKASSIQLEAKPTERLCSRSQLATLNPYWPFEGSSMAEIDGCSGCVCNAGLFLPQLSLKASLQPLCLCLRSFWTFELVSVGAPPRCCRPRLASWSSSRLQSAFQFCTIPSWSCVNDMQVRKATIKREAQLLDP